MSLKIAFASVLKAMRATRGISQKQLAEVSSRTYIYKLERAQCSPTLEMITALSEPLALSPLTLVALTLGAQSSESTDSLVSRLQLELAEVGSVSSGHASFDAVRAEQQSFAQSKVKGSGASSHQTEFCFAS
ncbi:helix-turn-helix domain-containing protein [Pseudomonas sp. LS-2]|uniref:helix-turn-helix domain-containing protein n=1 Tax=Pseudomonas sp. LS-2 TaxID=2315859 RepID=UPI000E756277|nr:helix-turn-helix transcriptional regulator [Pseudomonas sp. LS-2]RJX74834.1 XRE family transcriptional regulator [Pseudomonas sp. LS-2]